LFFSFLRNEYMHLHSPAFQVPRLRMTRPLPLLQSPAAPCLPNPSPRRRLSAALSDT
jgi:hypothetical protein